MPANLIDWSNKYELGIEDIDLQHHYFLNLINKISDLLKDSNHKDYKIRLITELNAYARFHFISEENMMLASGYPEWAEHKRLHRHLLEDLSGKESQIGLHPSSDSDLEDIVDFLANWFSTHTLEEDKKFAEFFHSQQQLA